MRVSRGVIIKAGLRNVCILLVEAAEAATAAAASNVYIALRPRKKVCPRAAEKSIFCPETTQTCTMSLFETHNYTTVRLFCCSGQKNITYCLVLAVQLKEHHT